MTTPRFSQPPRPERDRADAPHNRAAEHEGSCAVRAARSRMPSPNGCRLGGGCRESQPTPWSTSWWGSAGEQACVRGLIPSSCGHRHLAEGRPPYFALPCLEWRMNGHDDTRHSGCARPNWRARRLHSASRSPADPWHPRVLGKLPSRWFASRGRARRNCWGVASRVDDELPRRSQRR